MTPQAEEAKVEYRKLGKWAAKVSEIGILAWLSEYGESARYDIRVPFTWAAGKTAHNSFNSLVEKKLIVGREGWDTDVGRMTVFYHITKRGRTLLKAWNKTIPLQNELKEVLTRIENLYSKPAR